MKRMEHRTISRFTAWALWSGLALLALTGAARAQFYAVTDLGALGGTNGMAYGINNHEQIVGTAQTGMGNYHGFMFDGGGWLTSRSWAGATVGPMESTTTAGWWGHRACR